MAGDGRAAFQMRLRADPEDGIRWRRMKTPAGVARPSFQLFWVAAGRLLPCSGVKSQTGLRLRGRYHAFCVAGTGASISGVGNLTRREIAIPADLAVWSAKGGKGSLQQFGDEKPVFRQVCTPLRPYDRPDGIRAPLRRSAGWPFVTLSGADLSLRSGQRLSDCLRRRRCTFAPMTGAICREEGRRRLGLRWSGFALIWWRAQADHVYSMLRHHMPISASIAGPT